MKTIIIYATKYGCTAQAAQKLKAALGGEAAVCNLMKETVPPLDDYDTVVLGGSVYIGKIQKQLTAYLNKNLETLLGKTVGLFLCAGAPNGSEGQAKQLESVFPAPLFAQAAAKDTLGYAYSFEKMGFFERFIMKKIKGDDKNSAEFYDDKIAAFAQKLKESAK